jgi:hypothetical protein
MAEVLRNAMDNGVLERSDPWVAALHLKALLEAEFHEQAMLALEPVIDPSRIGPAVKRAVAFFLRGYRPGI